MDHDSPPVRWRELLSMALLVAASDATVYRGAGYAALFVAPPLLLLLGAARVRGGWSVTVVGAMLALLAIRLVWCGSVLQAAIGFALRAAFAVNLPGMRPYVFQTVMFAAQTLVVGYGGLRRYTQFAERREDLESLARKRNRQGWTSFQMADRLALERLRGMLGSLLFKFF